MGSSPLTADLFFPPVIHENTPVDGQAKLSYSTRVQQRHRL
jgi:hypothetical protein